MNSYTSKGTGNPINRVEGKLKVTGMAKYASEFNVKDLVYAQGINSTIARGRITALDTSEAEAQKGVLAVITLRMLKSSRSTRKTYIPYLPPVFNRYCRVTKCITTGSMWEWWLLKLLSKRNMQPNL